MDGSEKYPKISKRPYYEPPVELLKTPKEHLLSVRMGEIRMLIPGTSDYDLYDGVETGALATCSGLALYIPKESNAFLAVGHLAPTQAIHLLMDELRRQLNKAGVNFQDIQQMPGYFQFILGQTTYDRDKEYLRDKITRDGQYLARLFPRCRSFPWQNITDTTLKGHTSSKLALLKSGRLLILGEGKAY